MVQYDFSQFIRDPDGKVRSNRKLNNNNYGKMGDETWYDYLQNNKESMVQSDYAPVNEGNADFGFVARNDNGYTPLSRKDKLKNYNAALSSAKHKLEGKDSVQVEEAIESSPEEFVDSPLPEIAEEAQQIVNNDDKRDDEVNNEKVEKALRKTIPGSEPDPLGLKFTNKDRANWNGGKDKAMGDKTLSEMDAAKAERTRPVKPGTEMLSEAKPKGILGAGLLNLRDNKIPKPSEERPITSTLIERLTEENPIAVADKLEGTPIADEATQITNDTDARNDEVNNEVAEEAAERLSEDFETVDDLVNYLRTPDSGIDWDALERKAEEEHAALERGEEIPGFPKVSDKQDWVNNPTYNNEEYNDDVIPEYSNDTSDDVVDPGLEDQNQYADSVKDADATVVSDEELPLVNYGDFQAAKGFEHMDNVLELKEPEVEDELDTAENKDEASWDTTSLPHLRPTRLNLGGSASGIGSNAGPKPEIRNYSVASGNVGSFLRNIGSGIGSVGNSSVSNFRTKSDSIDGPYRKAGGGATIKAQENSSSPVISGKQNNSAGFTSSIGSSLSSGATNKKSSLVVHDNKLPSFTGHTAPETESPILGGDAVDLRSALIERIKGMLDNLDKDTRKELGFSPTLYNYKGTPLDKLDGAMLSQLSEMLENM